MSREARSARWASRRYALALDATDVLAHLRERFVVADNNELIYLDGNSLGRLPKATAAVMTNTITEGWGEGLVRSWNEWIDLPSALGDRLAKQVLGAGRGEVVVADSTSVNLYKLASAALAACPHRKAIVVDAEDFPTNRYVLQGLAGSSGRQLRELRSDPSRGPSLDHIWSAVNSDVGLVVLSLVSYRSGALLNMAAINNIARRAGTRVLWDLSHAAGVVPIELAATNAELAVGCTYKYLNAGPGAPAFAYLAHGLQGALRQPIWGWFGQRDQFNMRQRYDPVPGVEQLLVGTPPVLAMRPLEPALDILAEAGVAAVREKAVRQGELIVHLVDDWLAPLGFQLASPRDPAMRGAHVSLAHPEAWRICRALALHADVVADFRAPDLLRLGAAPLYTRYIDIWNGMDRLRRLVEDRVHERVSPERTRVT